MGPRSLFGDAHTVVIYGIDRRLLNWFAYAVAFSSDRDFLWVDVAMKGEVRSEPDVLSKGIIPAARFASVRAADLAPSNATANIAVSGVVRDDETPENLQRLMDFLRLPERTQHRLSTIVVGGEPKVVVLSNAHRLGPFYPVGLAAPVLRAIRDTGVAAIFTSADPPNDARFAFDAVLHLEGHDPADWRQSTVRVEKGPDVGPFRTGSVVRLEAVEAVSTVLGEHLG